MGRKSCPPANAWAAGAADEPPPGYELPTAE
jgi:hypothetical protein